MAGSLSGAWAKFDRAEEHLEALIRVTRSGHVRWGHQYPVTPEAQRNGLEYRFYVDRAPALDAERCAVIVGDCLFNLRAALDHIAYELHFQRYRGSIPADAEKASSFPILSEPRLNKRKQAIGTAKWPEIKRLSIKQRRAIEFLQPYQRRNDYLGG